MLANFTDVPDAETVDGRATGSQPTQKLWNAVRDLVAGSASQASFVELFELKSLAGQAAEVVIRDPSKQAFARTKVEWVAGLLSKAAGYPVSARLVEAAAPTTTNNAPTSLAKAGAPAAMDAASRAAAMENPLVKKAIDLFNARLVGIEPDPE